MSRPYRSFFLCLGAVALVATSVAACAPEPIDTQEGALTRARLDDDDDCTGDSDFPAPDSGAGDGGAWGGSGRDGGGSYGGGSYGDGGYRPYRDAGVDARWN